MQRSGASFPKIRDELSEQWSVLHSLGLAMHTRKPWAEIDFVLVGPTGVYCLEVKGGRIARTEGVWTTMDRDGRTKALKESPFAQVGSASSALHKYLLERCPEVRDMLTGYGVATPDIRFTIAGPDVILELVYDDSDEAAPFERFVERMAAYWRSRLKRGEQQQGRLGSEQRRAVVSALIADFDLRPSLRAQVGRAKDELMRLTEEQLRVFDGLRDNLRVVVRGGAGTGKSFLAVEEARRLAASGDSVLYTCFNRKLAEYLAPAATGCPSMRVVHLHGFMAEVVSRAGLASRLPDADPADLFDSLYPELCLEALLSDRAPQFNTLIVDEAQDLLLDAYVDVFDGLLVGGLAGGTWRIFLDPYQDVLEKSGSVGLMRFLRTNATQYRLSVNCRNTASIATAASLMSGAPLDMVLCTDGPEIVQEWYEDDTQQRHAVSKLLRQWIHNGIRPSEIVVLSPRRLENSCLAGGLISVPAALVDATKGHPGPGEIPFCTVHAFKGLESTAVALVDVEDISSSRGAAAVYVGASRAQALLAVLIRKTQQEVYGKRAFEFGQRVANR